MVLIGRDAPAMAAVLVEANVPLANATSMEEAVEASYALAHKGDAVLLSPACASFDAYANYGERGDDFATEVGKLLVEGAPR